jgi:hypothetical protein
MVRSLKSSISSVDAEAGLVAWRGEACGVAWRGGVWRGVAWGGWRGVAWRVACGVVWRAACVVDIIDSHDYINDILYLCYPYTLIVQRYHMWYTCHCVVFEIRGVYRCVQAVLASVLAVFRASR